jgi:hypothetical protein
MAAKFRQTRDNQFFKLIRMKRILFILILSLFSCEKDNLTPSDPTQHFVEFTFVQVVNKPKKAFKNGQEMSSFSFPAQTGDVIRVEAYNMCSWLTSTGTQSCNQYTTNLNIDGIQVASKTCHCELLILEHTIN